MENVSTADQAEIERFSRIADEWWDEKGKFRPLHQMNPLRIRYIRDKVCEHFAKNPDAIKSLQGINLLDIGCGGGLLCEPLTRMGANVTAIDASEKNIKVAALHAEKMGLSIDYRCSTPENLGESEKYDVITALEIVEHVADVQAFIKACAGLLKPGGILFLSTLNRTAKSYLFAIAGAEYILRLLPRGTHDWKKFLKPSELCSEVRNAGLSVEHMTGMKFLPLTSSWQLADNDLDVNYLLTAIK